MAKEPPISRLTFNSVAVVLVLMALPLAVGAITNTAGADEDRNWTPSYLSDNSGTQTYALWVNNGEDYSNTYEAQNPNYGNCSYFAAPEVTYPTLTGNCQGAGGNTGSFNQIGSIVSTTSMGVPAIEMPVDHNTIPAGGYLGSSGSGPFTWTFTANVNQIPNGELPEAFRWTFLQPSASYSCTSSNFHNITYDIHASWMYYDPTLPPGQNVESIFQVSIDSVESSNLLQYDAYIGGHWTTGCFIGMTVQIELTGYEQVALNNAAQDFNWSSIYIQLTLDDFEVDEPGEPSNIGQTELPWHGDSGDSDFLIVQEYSTRNEAEVNFFIRGGTLVLSLAVFLVGVGSTPYWDPLKAWFRGRV